MSKRPREVKPDESIRPVAQRNKLVEDNLGLVGHIFKQMLKNPNHNQVVARLDQRDAIAAGNLALVRAAERWDESRERFSTYACRCVWGQIMVEAKRNRIIHVPDDHGNTRRKQAIHPERIRAGHLAQQVISLQDLRRLVGYDYDGQEDNRDWDFPDPSAPDPVRPSIDLSQALCRLRRADRDLLDHYFYRGMKLREIAQQHLGGVCTQAVSLRLRKALARLRKILETEDV